MPPAARRRSSVPARALPRALPDPAPVALLQQGPRPWKRALVPMVVGALCFALGAGAPILRDHWQHERSHRPAPLPTHAALPAARTRQFPREAAALRRALDASAAPSTLVELVERLGILGDPSDFDRLAELAEHPNPGVSSAAMRALARVGGDRSIDRLTVFARGNDDVVSVAALQALGLAESPQAVDVLLEVAGKASDWRQNVALQALATRGGSRARAALHRGLKKAPANDAYSWAQAVASLGEPDDRLLLMTLAGGSGPRADAALNALAGLGSADSDSLLIALAQTATGNRRLTALTALGSVRDPRAVDVLVGALTGNSGVRGAAVGALGVSRAHGALDGLLLSLDGARANEAWQITAALASRPEAQARAVLKLLATEAGPLADAALAALAQEGDAVVGELLIAAFDERGELPPESTYHFLAVHGGEAGWSLLEEILADGSTNDRNSVIYALQARGDEHAVTRLLDIAASEDTWVASTAIGALEGLGDDARDSLRGILLQRVQDGDDASFGDTAASLARLGGDEVRDMLVGRLQDGTQNERSAALMALGQMDDAGAHDALQQTLGSDDPELRRQAFDALVWSGQPLDRDTVTDLLADPDPTMRSQAITALANLGDPASVEQLMALSADDDVSVRMTAVSALGNLGGPEAETGLLAAMEDPELFDTALWSLSSLGTSDARQAIRDAVGSDDPVQRASAIGALGNDRSGASRDLLVGALRDTDQGVVGAALSQLQMQGSSTAAAAVAELLVGLDDGDDPFGVRWQAANTLQSLGGGVAREHRELIDSILGSGWGDEDWRYGVEEGGHAPLELLLE